MCYQRRRRPQYIGYGGGENIQWENSNCELSLLIFEEYRGKGYGIKAIELILDNIFNYFGLKNAFLECYESNRAGIKFWNKILDKYNGYRTTLPSRKYYKGKFYGALYGNISKDNYNG